MANTTATSSSSSSSSRATSVASTPWGQAHVLEEVNVKQTGEDGREFAAVVQLLEGLRGESLVRFSYSTDAAVRRGPLTLRASDIVRLKKAIAKKERLRGMLNWKD